MTENVVIESQGPAIIIKEDGSATLIPPVGERVSLRQMQDAVQGHIEHLGFFQRGHGFEVVDGQRVVRVTFPDGADVYGNDAAKLKDMPVNHVASILTGIQGDVICGPIIIVPFDQDYEEQG